MFIRASVTHYGISLLLAGTVLLAGCGASQNPADSNKGGGTRVFNPPNTEFARGLGIQGGPISEEQARAIAEKATGGTARSTEREDQDGMDVFGIAVQAASGNLDVKVRVSDGAVTQIDEDDPAAEGDPGEGEDSDAGQ